MIDIKHLTGVDVIGNDSESCEDSNITSILDAGGVVVAGLGFKGRSEPENISCAVSDWEGDANEVAADGRSDNPLLIEVGEGGGDGFKTEKIIPITWRLWCVTLVGISI